MKKYLIIAAALTLFFACNNPSKSEGNKVKPGDVIAKDDIPVAGDSLNQFHFTVTVKADSDVDKGVYAITAVWGNNTAESKFMMPKGGESIQPILRQSSKPNAFIIGFKAGKDTTFNEYYEVSGEKGTIKMMYVKSYSFQ